MDSYKQELAENLEKYLIGLDDTFKFKCRMCGKCCRDREDILLTTRDLFYIARKLGLTPEETINKYCEMYIGSASRIPIVRLKPKGYGRVCPLLGGDRCIVHDCKPAVCALYPLGRVYVGSAEADAERAARQSGVYYIINPEICGSLKHTYTVRSWLESFNIPVEDAFYLHWAKELSFYVETVRSFEERRAIEPAMNMIWGAVFQSLYLDYDTSLDLMEQFLRNTEHLRLFMEATAEIAEHTLPKKEEDNR
jgi:Fe-S-cluster containining protein